MDDNTVQPARSEHQCDLPAPFSIGGAIILMIAFTLFSHFGGWVPFRLSFGIMFLLCYRFTTIQADWKMSLGLGFRLTRSARRLTITILLLITTLTPLGFYALQGVIEYSRVQSLETAASEDDAALETQILFDDTSASESAGPDARIYAALERRDLADVFRCMIKPIVASVITAPIFESIIMFGLLFPAVCRRFGRRTALWLIPVIFTLMHFKFVSRPFTTPLLVVDGFIMAFLYVRTRSLYPTILIHALANISTFAFPIAWNWGLPAGP